MKLFWIGLLLAAQAGTRTGTITGWIVKPDGTPAANVRVAAAAVDDGALSSIVQTDADGRYRLENVDPGRYYISAGPVSFPTYYPGVERLENPAVVSVTSGTVLNDLNFPLKPISIGFKVQGVVVREGPLAGTGTLQVMMSGANGFAKVASAGADGKFEFSGAWPGRYRFPSIHQSLTIDNRS